MLKSMRIEHVTFSEAQLAYDSMSTVVPSYILDVVVCPQRTDYDTAKTNIRELAARMSTASAQTSGMLACKGYVSERNPTTTSTAFTMIFEVAQWSTAPRSLRDLLVNLCTVTSLSHKFSLAQQLARSVFYVHAFGFVHKTSARKTFSWLITA
jgi:hypothetical protein